MTSNIRALAPGKIILSGEHAVVYGYPALVTAVDIYAKAEVEKTGDKIEIFPQSAKGIVLRTLNNTKKYLNTNLEVLKINLISDIPIGCGMGSSAAVSVCVAAGLMKTMLEKIDLEKVSEIAYETEKHYHGKPSGVDTAISTYGGILWFRKETKSFKTFVKVEAERSLNDVLLINSGKPKENTKEMVMLVAHKYSKNSRKVEKIFQNIEKVTRSFLKSLLREESISYTELIRENERRLEELGVVSESTVNLIKKIEKMGGAAKISGAGGKKGNSGILLTYHEDRRKLLRFAKDANLSFMPAKLTQKGVRIEKI